MGIGDIFSSSQSFKMPAEPAEIGQARSWLMRLAGMMPNVPLRKIAPIQPMGKERTLARETATEFAQPKDIFELPEIQGIIQQATEKGNLLANRLGRSLQMSGNMSSTAGRDVLGRAATDVSSNLAATLAPYAEAQRSRRERQIGNLENLGLSEEDRQRAYVQMINDALYNQITTRENLPFTHQAPILQSVMGSSYSRQPTSVTSTQGLNPMGIFNRLTSMLGPILGNLFRSRTGGQGQEGNAPMSSIMQMIQTPPELPDSSQYYVR